ncbi:MAG: ABC-2 family transporter protein [Lachnospiraceae bacterium]
MYKRDFVFMSISNIAFLLGSILFWYLVTNVGFAVEGWTFSKLLVYVAYSELFYGFHQNIFGIASSYWKAIYTGFFDVQICRPMDTRFRLIFLNADFGGIVFSFIKFLVILAVSKESFGIVPLLISIAVVFWASLTFALIQFIFSYMAFWLHKVEAIVEISENLTLFNKYPLDIFPLVLRSIVTVIFPFYFFSTFPAKVVLEKYAVTQIVMGVILLIANLIFWFILNKIVFQRGRMRYESIQG